MVKTLNRTIADDTNELPGDAPKPSTRKPGFRTQKEAKDCGLFELGEFARHGFEYETYKCDGRWFWRKHDEVKPPTAADLKASGGKKAERAEGRKSTKNRAEIDKSHDEQAKHEQRGAERAKAEGRLRPEGSAALTQDGKRDAPLDAARGTSLTALAQAIQDGTPGKAAGASEAPEASPDASAEENASGTIYGAGHPFLVGDPLDIPTFLQRPKPTAAETEAVRKKLAKVVGPERAIKNPPDAKMAKAKATKRAAGSKTALIGSMLLDPKGCTTAEVLKATGWPAVGMPAQAKACGLKLRKVKDGKVTRYFGSK